MRKLIEQITDDIDGGPATTEVVFGWQGKWYRLDLNDENAEVITTELTTWASKAMHLASGDKIRRARPKAGQPTERGKRESNRQLREWARENGYSVPSTGPIPAEVRDAYANRDRKVAAGDAHDHDECEDLDNCGIHGVAQTADAGEDQPGEDTSPLRVVKGTTAEQPKVDVSDAAIIKWARKSGAVGPVGPNRRHATPVMRAAYEKAHGLVPDGVVAQA